MLSAAQNDRLTRVMPGTPGGQLLRHYWHPVALAAELDAPQQGVVRPVLPARLLGQDLVLFRGTDGRPALLDRACAHRGADLSYGRLEDGGLRCPFHGWLFAPDGRCLQTPAEPAASRLCKRVRQRAWPVREVNGVIFAWLGEADPLALPALDCLNAPDSHVFAYKGLWHCNWLQAQEVGIDPAHASFLHRFFEDDDPAEAYGRQFRSDSANSTLPMTKVLREFDRPDIRVVPTSFGLRLLAVRDLGDEGVHLRVTNGLFPNAIVIPLSASMTITQWHVPVDDTHCYWFAMFTSFAEPVDKDAMRRQREPKHTLPDYAPRTNAANRFCFDAAEQEQSSYTGLGEDINVHDQWAVESPGPITDRTREHLGTTDRAIIANRRLLLAAIKSVEAGGPAPIACAAATDEVNGPATIDTVCQPGVTDDAALQTVLNEADTRRRAQAWGGTP